MPKKNPIVAVTGSSGAGTTTVRHAFQDIFRREGINAAFVDGNAFARFSRDERAEFVARTQATGEFASLFGPDTNHFDKLETLFKDYVESGTGMIRTYVTEENKSEFQQPAGTFTPWRPLPAGKDLLFYEGLHGGVVARNWTRRQMSPSHNPYVIERRSATNDNGIDVAQYVDLLLGVVPVVNL